MTKHMKGDFEITAGYVERTPDVWGYAIRYIYNWEPMVEFRSKTKEGKDIKSEEEALNEAVRFLNDLSDATKKAKLSDNALEDDED